MAAISAALVKELREKTGVGMMECKTALQENDGDIEKAILYLRERGLSRAAKKSGRVAAEGMVQVYVTDDQSAGVALELNCETDFVSRNDDFQKFAEESAKLAISNKVTSIQELEGIKMASGETVKDALTNLIARIGENMSLRRVALLQASNGVVAGYTHMGGKIGSLVLLEGGKGDDVAAIGKDVAMHAAASAPRYLKSEDVSAEELEQEKDLARKKLLEEGKPENMIDKIMQGQMSKFYKEVCLVEQPFVKEPKLSVQKYVSDSKAGLEIKGFIRFQLGEGIEKKQENFAEEVAAQLKK